MAKKEQPKEEKAKELIISNSIGYRMKISGEGFEISYDQSNENNLASFMMTENVLKEMIRAVELTNAYTPKEKKFKRDKLEKMRKLGLEIENTMREVAFYILETKTQADYDKEKKPKLIKATTDEVKKLNLIKP